jgi:hypothetical protein
MAGSPDISDLGSPVKLIVNAGKLPMAQVTKRSFTEMGLSLDSEVFTVFKASEFKRSEFGLCGKLHTFELLRCCQSIKTGAVSSSTRGVLLGWLIRSAPH